MILSYISLLRTTISLIAYYNPLLTTDPTIVYYNPLELLRLLYFLYFISLYRLGDRPFIDYSKRRTVRVVIDNSVYSIG